MPSFKLRDLEACKRAFRAQPNEFDTAVVWCADANNVEGVLAEGTYDECLAFMRRNEHVHGIRGSDGGGMDLVSLRTGRFQTWVL